MIYDDKYKLWWPEFETGYQEVRDYLIRRVTDVDVAVKHVRTHGIAVQAGGHVGIFPRHLAKYFSYVMSFEAIPETAECLEINTDSYQHVVTHNMALGAKTGEAVFSTRRSGRSRKAEDGDLTVQQTTIDSLALPRCDLIYLDIEGSELDALEGAKDTIEKFRPVIVLEVLKGGLDKTLEWVEKNKYDKSERIHNDWIFTP